MSRNREEQRSAPGLVPAAETLRNAAAADKPAPAQGEERLSLFWRIFGGTLLSIAALVALTGYQMLASSIADIRHEVDQRARRDDFETSRQKIWDRMRDLQLAEDRVDETLRDRCIRLEEQLKSTQAAEQELLHEVQWLREGLVAALRERAGQLEEQVKAGRNDRQELVRLLQELRDRLPAPGERRTGPPVPKATPPTAE